MKIQCFFERFEWYRKHKMVKNGSEYAKWNAIKYDDNTIFTGSRFGYILKRFGGVDR